MRRILITGASRGIGRAIAHKLADADTTLFLHGRDRERIAQTCKAVEAVGCLAKPIIADLTNLAQINAIIDEAGAEPLDALVNNAGVAFVKPFDQVTLDEWRTIFATNVTAAFLLTKGLFSKMPRGASIVNILSIAAKSGYPNWSAYCMSKFALEGFSQSLREELRPRGIRVINIYPAATNTEIWNNVEGDWPREKMMLPSEIGDAVAYALSRPAEVAVENIDVLNVTGRL